MNLAFKDEQYKDYGLWNYINKSHLPLTQDFVDKVTELPDTVFEKNSFILPWKTHVQKDPKVTKLRPPS